MKLRYITPMLAAAGAAAAILAAPSAMAADVQSCGGTAVTNTVCKSPGNVQINDSTPAQFVPQYPYTAGGYVGGPIGHFHR
jgi:hypothetical protein